METQGTKTGLHDAQGGSGVLIPAVKIFACGGTIDKIYFDRKNDFQVGEPQIGAVLSEAGVRFSYEVESLFRKDSLDMTDQDRQLVRSSVAACPMARILITHGTDTMIETAKALQGVAEKTIILTGSMAPARFRESDAIFNIGGAVMAVQILPPGVWIVMHGSVFEPNGVQKNVRENRFEAL